MSWHAWHLRLRVALIFRTLLTRRQQFREQQEILNRRRNPAANKQYFTEMKARRSDASREAEDKIAWQRNPFEDPLKEFKKRSAAGKVNKLGYEDVPTGGIQVSAAPAPPARRDCRPEWLLTDTACPARL